MAARMIFVATLLTMAAAVQNRIVNEQAGSEPNQPGSPDISNPWAGVFPFQAVHMERQKLGARLMAASAGATTKDTCGGYMSYGDFTWCAAAMPKEVDIPVKRFWGPKLELPQGAKAPAGEGFVGISYGIRERDMWSEFLSNRYNVSTKLYDCYWKEDRGPMGTKDFHASAFGSKFNDVCPGWRAVDACYAAKYEPKHVCLDSNKPFLMTEDGRNLTFEPMSKALAGQAPLSVFLKMDIEGSEWEPLEWLLAHKEELGKIRTLDMEAHMQYLTIAGQQFGDTQMERKVKVMEGLANHFAVVGSTINHEHLKQKTRWTKKVDAKKDVEEPRVYDRTALFLDRYSISFVSRKVLAKA